MKIQKDTRRLILNDLIALGDLEGELEPSEFIRKVFPDAENMPPETPKYTTFLKEVWKHMKANDDWTWDDVLFHRLKLLRWMMINLDFSWNNMSLRGLEELNGTKKRKNEKLLIIRYMWMRLIHILQVTDLN